VKYREFEPHVSLREHVKCFWVMERESTREIPAEDVTPDPFIELIMSFGAPYHLRSEGGVEREMPKVFVVGLQEKPLRFRCDGSARLLATRFFAWGALPFLAEEGPGRLRTTLGREWNELAAKAASALVEEHLIGKLLTLTIDLPTIRAAAKRLHLRKGRFRMAELAECCDLSTRQVQRRFKEALGVSPKGLARAAVARRLVVGAARRTAREDSRKHSRSIDKAPASSRGQPPTPKRSASSGSTGSQCRGVTTKGRDTWLVELSQMSRSH